MCGESFWADLFPHTDIILITRAHLFTFHTSPLEIRAIATAKNTSCQNKSLKGTAGMQLHDNRVSFGPKQRGDSVVFSAVPQSWKSLSLTTSSVRLINVSNLSMGWIVHIGIHTEQSFCIRMLLRYFLAVSWTCESKPAKYIHLKEHVCRAHATVSRGKSPINERAKVFHHFGLC